MAALLLLIPVAAALGAIWWLRRRRTETLLSDLGRALALAAEAQQVCWRLDRHYAADLSHLALVRRDLAPFLEVDLDSRRCRWELTTPDDGSRFDLAILALPVPAPLRMLGRHGTLGYARLLTAHGDRGVVAYDSFAEERRPPPRQPQWASARV